MIRARRDMARLITCRSPLKWGNLKENDNSICNSLPSIVLRRIEAHQLHQILPLARAVELAELDSLPGAQYEFSVLDHHCDAVADEGGFHVAVAVAFAVLVIAF